MAEAKNMISDGLLNLTANLGTDRDKAAATQIIAMMFSPQTLLDTFRGSWAARKGVTIPAMDSCRAWRDWQADPEEISKLEAEERRLGLREKVLQARIAARLFGGAALLIGTGETDVSKPLNPERVKRLAYVTLVHKRQIAPGNLDTDPASEFFGQPASWTLNAGNSVTAEIHPSRLVRFIGDPVPDPAISTAEQGWGDSVLVGAMDAITNFASTAANTASLVFEAKVDTIGVPGLMRLLGEASGEEELLRRFRIAMVGKGINGALIHDAEEIIGQKNASFSGLPELFDRFSSVLCAAFDIPATRLMGQSPGGLNATGDSDLRNYYDRISAAQTLEMGPAMHLLDECLIRSALGGQRPEEVHYRWASLWQTSEKDRAEIGKAHSQTIKTMRDTGLLPDEALAEAAVNLLTESGVMPGLEGAVNEYHEGTEAAEADPEEGIEQEPGTEAKTEAELKAATDAAPRTLYVRRNVRNAADIIAWAKGQGFKTTLPAEDLHVTIAFSRSPVDWMKVGEDWVAEDELTIAAGGPRLIEALGKHGEAKVLMFGSSRLSWRHVQIKEAGASWDFPDYQPHITISYGEAPDLTTLEPYRGKIVLGPEIFEEVKEDWEKGIKEV